MHATIYGLGLDERHVTVEDIVQHFDTRNVFDVEVVSYTDGVFDVRYFAS